MKLVISIAGGIVFSLLTIIMWQSDIIRKEVKPEIPIMFARTASGMSMFPTTPGCKQETYFIKTELKIGNIISFKCSTEKCVGNKLKRIADIRDNCYFVMGDNQAVSYDSVDYGWLCGDDISIRGVLVGQGECL